MHEAEVNLLKARHKATNDARAIKVKSAREAYTKALQEYKNAKSRSSKPSVGN